MENKKYLELEKIEIRKKDLSINDIKELKLLEKNKK